MMHAQPSRTCSRGLFFFVLSLALAGCQGPGSVSRDSGASAPGTDPARLTLKLDQIPGVPDMPQAVDLGTRPAISQAAYSRLNDAKSLFAQQRYADAVLELDNALRYDRKQYEVQRLLMLACYLSGGESRARLGARETLDLNPQDEAAWFVMGRLATKSGQTEQALRYYRTALKCPPASASAEYRALTSVYLAMLLDDMGYAQAALDQFSAFDASLSSLTDEQNKHPEIVSVLKNRERTIQLRRARAFARLRNYRASAQTFASVAASQPEELQIQREFARILVMAGRGREALETARAFVQRQSASMESVDFLVAVHQWNGTVSDAAGELRRLAESHPDRLDLSLRLAQTLMEANRLKEASEVLLAVQQRHPKEMEAAWLLVDLLRRQSRWNEWGFALADILTAREDQYVRVQNTVSGLANDLTKLKAYPNRWAAESKGKPGEPAVLYVAAAVAKKLGDALNAETLLRRALQRNGAFVPAILAMGELFAERHHWSGVIEVAKAARKAGASGHAIEWLEGSGYDALDDIEQAVRLYDAAIKLNAKDRRTLQSQARLYQRIGDVKKAQSQYKELLAIDPLDSDAREQLFRLCVAAGDATGAGAQLAALREKNGETSPAYRRCEAFLKLMQTRDQAQYRSTLTSMIQADPKDGRNREDMLRLLFSLRRYDEAAEQARESLRIDPNLLTALEVQALVRVRMLDFEGAIETLSGMLKRHPNRETWNAQLARVYANTLKHDLAEAIWRRLCDSPSAKARLNLYRAELLGLYEQGEQLDRMRQVAESWLKENPGDAATRGFVLAACMAAKDYPQVLKYTSSWMKDNDAQKGLWQPQRIQALAQLKRYSEAQAAVLAWMAESPDDSSSLYWMGAILTDAGRFEDAADWLRNLMATTNEQMRLSCMEQLYRVQTRSRDYDAAIKTLKSLPREQRETELDSEIGRILIRAERFEEAEQHLKAVMERADTDYEKAEVLRLISYGNQSRKRMDQAEQRMVEAHRLAPDDIGVNNDLGYLWADMGKNLGEAERMLRAAVGENMLRAVMGDGAREARTVQAAYLDSLGWLYYKKADFEEARTWLMRSRSMRPSGDDPVIYDHLGDTLWRLNRRDEAEESWRRSVDHAEQRARESGEREDAETVKKVQEKLAAVRSGAKPAVALTAAEAAAASQPARTGGK